MTIKLDARALDRVHEALSGIWPNVSRVAPVRWQFETSDGHTGIGFVDENWLILDVDLSAAGPAATSWPVTPFRLLHWNAALPDPSKFVIAPKDRSLRLRSEMMIDARTPDEDRVRQYCTNLDSAFQTFIDRECQSTPSQESGPGDAPMFPGAECETLCREAELPIQRDADGRLTTTSAIEDSVRLRIIPNDGPGLRFSVEVPTPALTTSRQRRAVALVLLLATSSIRLVRAAARSENDLSIVSLDAGFPRRPSAAELMAARAALSIAYGQVSAETRLLQNEDLAYRYLSCQGFGTPLESTIDTKKKGEISWSPKLQMSST